ncbi:DUF2975 domain-containing protein [Microbacteriaceae bacterium K1510]|nr:DUF2975 domain-containing protein [Microbacteriaceae bacterium K1510]
MSQGTRRSNADKLVRLSQAMAWLTTAGIVSISAAMIAVFLIPTWTRNLLLARLGDIGASLPLGPNQVIAAASIMAVPTVVMMWGLWHVRALFREFAVGRVFTVEAARHLQVFGMAVLIQGPLGPLTATALAMALSLANPPGQRLLVVSLSINDYLALIIGGVLLAVATVMREAARLADENASFV